MTLDCTCGKLKEAEEELAAARKRIDGLERALELACEHVAHATGTCPYDVFDRQPRDCEEECGQLGDRYESCWALHFKWRVEVEL